MSALLATMNVCGAEAGATAMVASRSFPATINDDQRGPCADDATSAHNHFQFAGADAPRQRPVRFSSSLRTGHPIHAIRLPAGRAQSLADQLRSQIVAAPVIHRLNRLSKFASRSGSTDSRRELSWNANSLCIWSKK